ncbi:MAG TPA: alpha/beta hydrolase [Aquabacterium sp.]|uniref:RBBP9/YdeN family alpha/beta hydrolase n=1 Tax=Aquabacterium sp. TaxID=1872578 RepID=UPI002E380F8E|nr:alpha/beta hydrolase [Aquabacterium sp.]HEX5357116.1 alpha/beta hydrolase [Aquabacterium sp.]
MLSSLHAAELDTRKLAITRVLIIPGLRNSGHGHWQSWLQTQYRGAARVTQADWDAPDLQRWSRQIDSTLARYAPDTQWIAVAHSFGCLALAHHLARQRTGSQARQDGIRAALMVAPADPGKFQLTDQLPQDGLGVPATLVGSENAPWMPLEHAQLWATRWGAGFQNLGQAGHVNTESGFGPWPLARYKVDQMIRYLQRQKRLERAHPMEFNYGI